MIVTFGEHPPVYSKPKETNTPYPAQCKKSNAKIFCLLIVFHSQKKIKTNKNLTKIKLV